MTSVTAAERKNKLEARAWRDLEAGYRSVADEDSRDREWMLAQAALAAKNAADYETAAEQEA